MSLFGTLRFDQKLLTQTNKKQKLKQMCILAGPIIQSLLQKGFFSQRDILKWQYVIKGADVKKRWPSSSFTSISLECAKAIP